MARTASTDRPAIEDDRREEGPNQLSGAGYAYDVLGNLVEMPGGASGVFMSYLDQGHIGTLTDSSGGVWKYYYDADGKRRIKVKTTGGAATEPDGQGGVRLVADRSFYFYEGEDLICQQDVGALVQDESQYEPKFLLLDHLGSTRAELVFDPVSLAPQIQEYYDLMPYGEVIDPPTTQESVLFTGKPRDNESTHSVFGSRFYNSYLFRFISVDLFSVTQHRVSDPQQLNLYTYVNNNPLCHVDPTGMVIDTSQLSKKDLVKWNKVVELANKKDNEGKLVNSKLNELYNKLQNDPRIFSVVNGNKDLNDKLTSQQAGTFTITEFDGANDFSKAKISLNFYSLRHLNNTTQGDFDSSFQKYGGLLRDYIRCLAETFGHEAAHAEYAIDNPSYAVSLQRMINDRDESMRSSGYPIPPDIIQKSQAIDREMIPTERHAQEAEKIINMELRKKK